MLNCGFLLDEELILRKVFESLKFLFIIVRDIRDNLFVKFIKIILFICYS